MENRYARSELLLGNRSTKILNNSKVAVFGLGGVGGFAVEALARAGIGELCLIDGDKYSASNLNRQLFATEKTLGMFKTQAAANRVAEVNSHCIVKILTEYYSRCTQFDFSRFDYIIDAIDSVEDKVDLIVSAQKAGTPIISCMGAGNKLCATSFKVADIYDTRVCPLARVMRGKLKERGVERLKTVFSDETPQNSCETVGSVPYVPSVAGMVLAGEVIKDLIKKDSN